MSSTPPIPRNHEVKAYFYEHAVIGESRRFKQLDRYEAHYACRQYSHLMHDWWGMTADQMETVSPDISVPMGFTQPALALNVRAKRPTAPYNLCKAVVDRFTGLLFSDARKPDVTVEGDEETEQFLHSAMEQMRFWAKMREARTIGGSTGAALATIHLRNGRFCMEVHNPKFCQVLWRDRRTFTPEAVLVMFRYPVEEDVVDPKTNEIVGTRTVEFLYRRIITSDDDTVYEPQRLEPGVEIEWVEQSSVPHGLGFFPGVWIQNMPEITSEDGHPDCDGVWQNFDTIDRLLSQMNKAVLLNLDPTLVLGVDPKVVDAQGGVRKGSDNALQVGQGGDAKYLEITGSGIEAGMKVYTVLKQNTLDVARCVLVDPTTISGAAQSAKAIEYIYAPMLEKADDLRAQYGDLGVVPLLLLIGLIARAYSGKMVQIGADEQGQPIMAKTTFDLPPNNEGKTPTIGPGGYIRLKWGPYFSPTEQDKQLAVATVVAAHAGGVISGKTAVQQGAPLFGVRDTEAETQLIAEELEQEASRVMAGMGGDLEPAPGPEGGDHGPPAGGGGKP